MRIITKKGLASVTIFLFLGVTVSPIIASGSISDTHIDTAQELYLLHAEAMLYLYSEENVSSFNFSYSIPPNYENQAPIYFMIINDTTADVISFNMSNDTNPPNKLINLVIGPMEKGDNATLHFSYWVIVKNKDYSDLPRSVKIPRESELPEETKTWLVSTKAIQSDNILIKLKARKLRGLNNNLIRLADKIVRCTHIRRYIAPLWVRINIALGRMFNNISFGWAKFGDAVSCLYLGGACQGAANLGTALFRANGVPAKDLIVIPTVGSWYCIHYTSEYYCPGYGWVLTETSKGKQPYPPEKQIILRVNYPEDENYAGKGLDYYGGCEQVSWTDTKKIVHGPMHRAWYQKALTTSYENAELSFEFTQKVWEKFTQYAGLPLSEENQEHFYNATKAQQDAMTCFLQSDINGYIENITLAYNEYNLIENL